MEDLNLPERTTLEGFRQFNEFRTKIHKFSYIHLYISSFFYIHISAFILMHLDQVRAVVVIMAVSNLEGLIRKVEGLG